MLGCMAEGGLRTQASTTLLHAARTLVPAGTRPAVHYHPNGDLECHQEKAQRGRREPGGGAGADREWAPGNILDWIVVMAAPLKKFIRTNWTVHFVTPTAAKLLQDDSTESRPVPARAGTLTTKGDEGTFGVLHLNWGCVYRGTRSCKQKSLNWTLTVAAVYYM